MSDIKVGDLVMIVRGAPCCGFIPKSIGVPWRVAKILTAPNWVRCASCGHSFVGIPIFIDGTHPSNDRGGLRSMLLKINPPPREEEEPAPPVMLPEGEPA